jgi:hypothetical protein
MFVKIEKLTKFPDTGIFSNFLFITLGYNVSDSQYKHICIRTWILILLIDVVFMIITTFH